MQNPTHCRLSIILATDAPKGVILRRGPSDWVQLILWNTHDDTFAEGQWFKGRIYAERCDLSPDGTKFIYFAAKHHVPFSRSDEMTNTWTAISKPPYFTALALWSGGGTTHGGGGYFEDDLTICLRAFNNPYKDHVPPDWFHINTGNCDHDASSELRRLKQSGWKIISRATYAPRDPTSDWQKALYATPEIHQKEDVGHNYRLTMQENGYNYKQYGDRSVITYTLQRKRDQAEFLISDTWADWDQQGRFVYAEQGKLFAGNPGRVGTTPVLLKDFNPNQVRLIQSPEWAKTWTGVDLS